MSEQQATTFVKTNDPQQAPRVYRGSFTRYILESTIIFPREVERQRSGYGPQSQQQVQEFPLLPRLQFVDVFSQWPHNNPVAKKDHSGMESMGDAQRLVEEFPSELSFKDVFAKCSEYNTEAFERRAERWELMMQSGMALPEMYNWVVEEPRKKPKFPPPVETSSLQSKNDRQRWEIERSWQHGRGVQRLPVKDTISEARRREEGQVVQCWRSDLKAYARNEELEDSLRSERYQREANWQSYWHPTGVAPARWERRRKTALEKAASTEKEGDAQAARQAFDVQDQRVHDSDR